MTMKDETASQPHAQKILGKLKDNRDSLYIQRIPGKTKKAFIEFAHAEFCGDYGMALKWLLDDIPGQDTRMLTSMIENHEARILGLENKTEVKKSDASTEPKKEVRRMLDGTKIERSVK